MCRVDKFGVRSYRLDNYFIFISTALPPLLCVNTTERTVSSTLSIFFLSFSRRENVFVYMCHVDKFGVRSYRLDNYFIFISTVSSCVNTVSKNGIFLVYFMNFSFFVERMLLLIRA